MPHSSLEFLTPKHIQVDQVSSTQAQVILEPLERGLAILWVMPCVGSCCRACRDVRLRK